MDPGEPANGEPVTARIGPEGGRVAASTDRGASVEIRFPSGALRRATDITLRPLATASPSQLAVDLEPAGLLLYADAAVTVTLPDGEGLADGQLFVGVSPDEGTLLPTLSTGNTLEGTLRAFGTAADGGVIWSASRLSSASFTFSGGSNTLQAQPVACAQLISSMEAQFQGYLALGEFERAIAVASGIASLLQRAACPGVADWVATATQTACVALQEAINAAASAPTTSARAFRDQTRPIVHWEGIGQEWPRFDDECAASPNAFPAIAAEGADFVDFHAAEVAALQSGDWSAFTDLKDHAMTAWDLFSEAQFLGLLDTEEQLRDSVFTPAVAAMRTVAYGLCRQDGWHYALSRLTPTGFFASRDIIGQPTPRPGPLNPPPDDYAGLTADTIFGDLQGCGTEIELWGEAGPGGATDVALLGGAAAPGKPTVEGAVEIPIGGEIVIGGRVDGFTCWDGSSADERLEVRLAGTVIRTISRGPDGYVSGEVRIDADSAASTAGLTPVDGNTNRLTIRRIRTGCDERLWGPEEFDLADVTITWREEVFACEVLASGYKGELLGGDTELRNEPGHTTTASYAPSYLSAELQMTMNGTGSRDWSRRKGFAAAADSIWVLPENASQLGARVKVRVTLDTRLEASYLDGSSEQAFAAGPGGHVAACVFDWCDGRTPTLSVTDTFDVIADLGGPPKPLGIVAVRGEVGARGTSTAFAKATTRIVRVEILGYGEQPLPDAKLCSASGTTYPR